MANVSSSIDVMSQSSKMSEACKIALSSMPLSSMSVNIDDKTYTMMLDNNKLIEIAASVFERVAAPIRKVLRDARLKFDDIEDIILVGGSCKMPTVAAFIEKITSREVCTDINPDTAIGMGAGIFAGMKARNKDFKEVVMTDICPFTLGISVVDTQTQEKYMDFLIQRNSILPTSVMRTYYASCQNQTKLIVDVYQGESLTPSKNILLGTLTIDCPPTALEEKISDTRLTYDINGILMIDVITTDGVKHEKVILSNNNMMSPAEIERRKKHLETLKIAPTEKEANRLLLARAESAIEECLGFQRDFIVNVVVQFKKALFYGNPSEIRAWTERLKTVLDELDGE